MFSRHIFCNWPYTGINVKEKKNKIKSQFRFLYDLYWKRVFRKLFAKKKNKKKKQEKKSLNFRTEENWFVSARPRCTLCSNRSRAPATKGVNGNGSIGRARTVYRVFRAYRRESLLVDSTAKNGCLAVTAIFISIFEIHLYENFAVRPIICR